MSDEDILFDDPESTSRPASGLTSRKGSALQSRPATAMTSRPTSGFKSRPSSRPMSSSSQGFRTRPVTGKSSRPASGSGSTIGWAIASSDPDGTSLKPEKDPSDRSGKSVPIIEDDPYIDDPPKGCWYQFTKCLCSFWSTREISAREDQNFYIRTTIRELVLYSLYLLLLCFLTFGMTSATMFYYTQIIQGFFYNQTQNVAQVTDFWDFMNNDLLNGLYWSDNSDDGSQRNYLCPTGNETAGRCPVSATDKIILYGNFMIGVPRLRQLRVRNNTCDISQLMQRELRITACYGPYAPENEDTISFGLANYIYAENSELVTSIDAWTYNTSSDLNGTAYTGTYASYSGAGSIQDLDSLKVKSAAIISELQEGLWITRGTRFVSVDVTLYNPNLNYFCIIKLVFEFLEVGGVIPSASFFTVKLMPYVTQWDFFILACQIVFVVFVVYYIVEEGIEIRKLKLAYFKNIYNCMDLAVIAISLVAIAIQVYMLYLISINIDEMLRDPNIFADFTNLGSWAAIYNNVIAVLVLTAWLKIFKYITFNRTMTQLNTTLSRCSRELGGFFLMFMIVFFAFDILAYLWFGALSPSYAGFVQTTFTLMRIILADFDFQQVQEADAILGPIFFFVYIFFVFIILVNVFLAIVNDTYHWVMLELEAKRSKYVLGDYLKEGYNNVLDKVLVRERAMAIEQAINMADADGDVTYEEIRQNLKKCNFSDVEIEVFFARYDIDGKFVYVPEDEESTEKEKKDEKSSAEPEASAPRRKSTFTSGQTEEFLQLSKRVDNIEHSILAIIPKLDLVLYKLQAVEDGNEKKRATMGRILGTITEDDGMDDEAKRRQVEEMLMKPDHRTHSA